MSWSRNIELNPWTTKCQYVWDKLAVIDNNSQQQVI